MLAANDATLATVALRPRLIWGPGDNQLLPRLVERARSGRLRFVGGGHNRIDTTYIDNAAQAHLDALDHLHARRRLRRHAPTSSPTANPRPVREIVNGLLRAAGAPPVDKITAVPRRLRRRRACSKRRGACCA